MSVDTYPYAEWTKWPAEDVREWAEEIAAAFALNEYEAASLLEDMLSRAGLWREPAEAIRYPIKMTDETEASYTAAYIEWHASQTEASERPNSIASEIVEQNRRLNRPWQRLASAPTKWERKKVVGGGLTSRTYWEPKLEGFMLKESRRARAQTRSMMAKRPLRHEKLSMASAMNEWLWKAGCVRLGHERSGNERWMVPESQEAERDGMWWYYEAVNWRLEMAKRQIAAGEAERAAWHSLHAGRLFAEMEIKALHDEFFKKTLRTHEAQVDAGRASRAGGSDAERQACWQRYRDQGHKRKQAGEMAGSELGISETAIRRAFGGSYP